MSIFDSENFDEIWNSLVGESFSCHFDDVEEPETSDAEIV